MAPEASIKVFMSLFLPSGFFIAGTQDNHSGFNLTALSRLD